MAYQNPVLSGFYPDPSVCRVGEDYYLATSSFEYFPGVPLFHSRDLIHWKQIAHVLTRPSQLPLERANSSEGIFAPTLRHHDGIFYMATTNRSLNANFYVWTDDPAGEWSDPIVVDMDGYDPSLFFDDDGRVYFTACRPHPEAEIIQCEIDIRTGARISEVRSIWQGTGGAYPEGPHIYRIGGKIYLIIAEGGTENGHMVTVARSDNPWGPYESCPYNPILTHRSRFSPIHATGHADLLQAHDGSWWAVFLGTRPVPYPFRTHLGRETFLAPVSWTEAGWPLIGDKGQVALEMHGRALPHVKWEEAGERDHFDQPELGLEWNFLRNPRKEDWSLAEHSGFLTLRGSEITLDDADSPAFIGRRQQHFHCSVQTALHFAPQQDREEAGLTVFMNERFHYEVAVTRDEGQKGIIFRRRIGTLWKVEAFVELISDEVVVELGVEADPHQYMFTYKLPDDEAQTIGIGECCLLAPEVAGDFTGVYFGLYATGNGRRSAAPALFDWFDYVAGES
ncbi:alpha-N-arabinofuranosidase [Paenibacillus algorifonticola]|uniref:Alpha-N-arabinofuranosidase n=1 Tax=Paenibacillus algorifonticola TaxID=684063 RepID=A0A1I2HVS1_9BACL|nr:glycoside hydrolase family 43 protein [Paenibacillus algorifonticola]SFF32471.1 alpha-N-arabinofuranosidase [Paenibacillus algorifonticola]